MGDKTNISWTDRTWNPVIGCSKVSPGCANCYAEQLSKSPKMRPFGYTGLAWTPENAHLNVQLKPERLEQPLHWRKPQKVFVNSMSDLFHELVSYQYIAAVFQIMAKSQRHTFQILTKRPDRMREFMKQRGRDILNAGLMYLERLDDFNMDVFDKAQDDPNSISVRDNIWPLPNVWLGTSVENQRWADERIPLLLDTPAAVRFLSCEPLLGALNLEAWVGEWYCGACRVRFNGDKCLSCGLDDADGKGIIRLASFFDVPYTKLHWVIVGGESGPRRRAMDLDWARSIRDQCEAVGIPFFFKQSGGSRSETGKELDGVRWEQMPAVKVAA